MDQFMRPTVITTIKKANGITVTDTADVLAAEEPLQISISYDSNAGRREQNIAVTMRTPGNDTELAAGFLFTEGIIDSAAGIQHMNAPADNAVLVALATGVQPEMHRLERNFYTTSSCGVCGKASVAAIHTLCPLPDEYPYDGLTVTIAQLYLLPAILRGQQSVFNDTGGIHACALFDAGGKLLLLREDVGRHNALDKLIGAALTAGMLPLHRHVLLLSGRASFELVQKAAMAGIKVIAAVGAPSSLAVELAEDRNMTLIGFLRGERLNIYTGAQRILIS